MSVQLAENFKREKVILDTNGVAYASMEDLKNHNPIPNGQNLISDPQAENEDRKSGLLQEQGMARPTTNDKDGEIRTNEKTNFEQIRIAILDSDLTDKDKVFMTMLLKDKNRDDALMAILTSPLKDKQKVNLMKVI